MGRFTLLLFALLLLRLLVFPAMPALSLLTLLLIIPAVYYSWRLFSLIQGRFLWKIRQRLILAHILIAVIPFALVVVILYVSGLLFYYQLSYYLVEKQIGIHTTQIHAYNLAMNADLQQIMSTPGVDASSLKPVIDREAKYLLSLYRTASIALRWRDPASGSYLVYAVGRMKPDASEYQIPRWISDTWYGFVVEDLQPEIYQSRNGRGSQGQLYLRSLVPGDFRNEIPYSLELSVPLDGVMLDRLKNALGQDMLLADHVPTTGLNVMLQDTGILRENVIAATFDLSDSQDSVGRPVWSLPLYPTSWSTGVENERPTETMLFVELSTSKLIPNVFQSETNVTRTIVGALQLVVGFFLAVELVSLIGGILLTKSITNAVYNLDRGTEFIKRGDFSHRIVVKSDDQLGALAKSFNQMTEYVQTLVKERVQKERLERELEIAKEVQEQLFPKRAPQLQKMELTGLCLPARIVSGDYYDFLYLDPHTIGLALGDICGKGISAALLMANLQATLRSNVMARDLAYRAEAMSGNVNVASVVRVLNQQICNFTSANKFASFFYAVYDDHCNRLTFTNAGHNPPLYFNRDGLRRLTTGGTVVGIFPDAEYEQETIQLESGDVFLAYTDGITECVNEYGEEFGEQRLIDLVQAKRHFTAEKLQKAIVDEVLAWAFEEERDDDMTLIVARVNAG